MWLRSHKPSMAELGPRFGAQQQEDLLFCRGVHSVQHSGIPTLFVV